MDIELDPDADVRRENMGHPDTDVSRLIDHARQARPGALDQLLTTYRNYLRLLARTGIDASLRGKADPSDLVQEALLKAHRHFGQFRGKTEAELAVWLRQILARWPWPSWPPTTARCWSCAASRSWTGTKSPTSWGAVRGLSACCGPVP
jgi:hypothetical protein